VGAGFVGCWWWWPRGKVLEGFGGVLRQLAFRI
jgi:hypothetical protein